MTGESEMPQGSEIPLENNTESQAGFPRSCKRYIWRVAGGVLAATVVFGWVCIIVVLILEEKWQLVLIAWLLLYAAAHFCYWYFKRHNLLSLNSQIRVRLVGHLRVGGTEVKAEDSPPSYSDVIKTETPPPAYYTVVSETPEIHIKTSSLAHSAIPEVFQQISSECSSATQSQDTSALEETEHSEDPVRTEEAGSISTISSSITSLPNQHSSSVRQQIDLIDSDRLFMKTENAQTTEYPPEISDLQNYHFSSCLEDPIRNPVLNEMHQFEASNRLERRFVSGNRRSCSCNQPEEISRFQERRHVASVHS